MKLIHGILGCALAAGLTAGALQAQVVVGNIVYTTLNINLMTQYNDKKGNVHEAGLTSKDILKLLGFSKSDKLATDYQGSGDAADVFVIDKKGAVIADLTTEDILSIDFTKIVNKRQDEGKNGSFDESEKGVIMLNFDFTGVSTQADVIAEGSAPPPSGEFSFDASGVYYWEAVGGAVKKGEQKIATKLISNSFVGNGFDSDIAPAPSIQSDAKTPGDGDFLIKGGTVNGSGSGTVGVD